MATENDYVAGTITLTNGSTTFSGTGTAWRVAGIRGGDLIFVDNLVAVIAPNSGTDPFIDSNVAGKLTRAWTGTTGTRAYRIMYKPDGARVTAETRNLIQLLGNGNLESLAGITPSANALIRGNAGGTGYESFAASAFAYTFLDDANGAAVYASLGSIPSAQLPNEISSTGRAGITDANTFVNTNGWATGGGSTTNFPVAVSGYLQNMTFGSGYDTQLWYQRDGNRIFQRSRIAFAWSAWQEIAGGSNGTNGYLRFPSGAVIQWGLSINAGSSDYTLAFPIAFPTACGAVSMINAFGTGSADFIGISTSAITASSCDIRCRRITGGVTSSLVNVPVRWIAIGY